MTELNAGGIYMKIDKSRNDLYNIINSVMNLKKKTKLTRNTALNCWYYILANEDWKDNDIIMITNIILMYKVVKIYLPETDEYIQIRDNVPNLFTEVFNYLSNDCQWFNEKYKQLTINRKSLSLEKILERLFVDNFKYLYLNNYIVDSDNQEDKNNVNEIDVNRLLSKEEKKQIEKPDINDLSYDELNKIYSEMQIKKQNGEEINEHEYKEIKERLDELYNQRLNEEHKQQEIKDISEEERNKILMIANEYQQTNDLSKYSTNDLEIYLDIAKKIVDLYQGTDKSNIEKLIEGINNHLSELNIQTIKDNIKSDDNDSNYESTEEENISSKPIIKTDDRNQFFTSRPSSPYIQSSQNNQFQQPIEEQIDPKQSPENRELKQLDIQEQQLEQQKQEIMQSTYITDEEKQEEVSAIENKKHEINEKRKDIEDRRDKLIKKYIDKNIISQYDSNNNFIINGTNIILNKNDLYNILHRRELDEALRGIIKIEHERDIKREEVNKALQRKIEQNMIRNKTINTNFYNQSSKNNFYNQPYRQINPLLLKHSLR